MPTAAKVLSPFFYFCCFRCVIVLLTGLINYVFFAFIFAVLLPIFVTWQGKAVNSRIVTEPTLLYFYFDLCGRWNLITNWYQSWLLGSRNVTVLTIQGHASSSFTWPFDSQVVISYRCSIGTKSVSPTIVVIMGPKYIGVMTLTFLVISYWWSIGPKSLSPAVFEIFDPKYIEVTTLTFRGHVTSSVTWPFECQVFISYRYFVDTKSVSPTVVKIMGPKYIGGPDFDLSGSHDVIIHVTILIPMGHFLLVVHLTQVSICNGFRDIVPQTLCAHRHAISRDMYPLCKI